MTDRMLVTLIGRWVVLEPFAEKIREELRVVAQSKQIWTYSADKAHGELFDEWFDKALREQQEGHQSPYIVRRKTDQRVLGSTRCYDINLEHRRLAIGYTWYVPEVWGTYVNPESKLLLLQQAFEGWQINRVAFHTDVRNLRSCAAIKKLGGKPEGILRQHMVLHDGYVRDTAVFSIIKSEWPAVKASLEDRLKIFSQEQ